VSRELWTKSWRRRWTSHVVIAAGAA